MDMGAILIYGATGYTGRLVAKVMADQGLRPVLAARSADALRTIAESLGLPWRVFALVDQAIVRAEFEEIDAVLLTAGPFSATSSAVVDACLATRTHYVDITGEIDVFEALAARDAEAKRAGVVLLPGAGFDVVPSDCLAAHLKARLPDATHLRIDIAGLSTITRGTLKTMGQSIARGTAVRRSGRIVETVEPAGGTVDFGEGLRPTIGVGWGDVSTAWYSTGVPNIDVAFEVTPELARVMHTPRFIRQLLATKPGQALLRASINRMPEGPTEEQRRTGRAILLGTAWNEANAHVASRLTTPEPYTLTANTAAQIVLQVMAGELKPGFNTPSTAFGADFILQFADTRREDL
ncbi:Saccharopine dehydrogenase [Burkholderia multivorans]